MDVALRADSLTLRSARCRRGRHKRPRRYALGGGVVLDVALRADSLPLRSARCRRGRHKRSRRYTLGGVVVVDVALRADSLSLSLRSVSQAFPSSSGSPASSSARRAPAPAAVPRWTRENCGTTAPQGATPQGATPQALLNNIAFRCSGGNQQACGPGLRFAQIGIAYSSYHKYAVPLSAVRALRSDARSPSTPGPPCVQVLLLNNRRRVAPRLSIRAHRIVSIPVFTGPRTCWCAI